ncbi:GspH/FimT family pseudopilin [Undibacterium sp. TJN19]|uniref:GspH/FimT family pseudopilin n=1 Tax=Undibacterium sp. TJN19 TaxID=3413055 RepID=UPI003BF21B0B
MNNRAKRVSKLAGFSLVELMVTLVIMSILTAIAYPSFQRSMQRARVTSEATSFSSDLAYAKGMAKKSSTENKTRRVSVCASSDGATCTGGSWNSGRIIFYDDNGDGIVTSGKDQVLQVRGPVTGTTVISVTNFKTGGIIQFNSLGEVGIAGVVKICDSSLGGNSGTAYSVLLSGLINANRTAACP